MLKSEIGKKNSLVLDGSLQAHQLCRVNEKTLKPKVSRFN
jgi:hypothetical protein